MALAFQAATGLSFYTTFRFKSFLLFAVCNSVWVFVSDCFLGWHVDTTLPVLQNWAAPHANVARGGPLFV